ncbi:hypothetical protein DSTSK_08420 [Desulforhabdus sp. TSK]|nr:hypothetical protein DSTSK_08420 [Desulforhabdus sp. TSK]
MENGFDLHTSLGGKRLSESHQGFQGIGPVTEEKIEAIEASGRLSGDEKKFLNEMSINLRYLRTIELPPAALMARQSYKTRSSW